MVEVVLQKCTCICDADNEWLYMPRKDLTIIMKAWLDARRMMTPNHNVGLACCKEQIGTMLVCLINKSADNKQNEQKFWSI